MNRVSIPELTPALFSTVDQAAEAHPLKNLSNLLTFIFVNLLEVPAKGLV